VYSPVIRPSPNRSSTYRRPATPTRSRNPASVDRDAQSYREMMAVIEPWQKVYAV